MSTRAELEEELRAAEQKLRSAVTMSRAKDQVIDALREYVWHNHAIQQQAIVTLALALEGVKEERDELRDELHRVVPDELAARLKEIDALREYRDRLHAASDAWAHGQHP